MLRGLHEEERWPEKWCLRSQAKCYNANNIFFACFVSLKTIGVKNCFLHYDVIYHPFPINSQYSKMWEVDSPAR